MTANLKPCYYCEGKKIVKREFSTSIEFTVECISCWARGPIVGSEAEAIEAWNHRPFEEKAVEVLAERLHHITQLERIHSNYVYWKDLSEATRNEYRAEAKQLLGVK